MKKVILDCDTGVDDAQAIMLALGSSDVDLIAITCVFGNMDVEQAAQNTARVLQAAGRMDIPVFVGCHKPLIKIPLVYTDFSDATNYHGIDGLGDAPEATVEEPPYSKIIRDKAASVALCDLINQYPHEITLVATAPLTNVAMAFRLDRSVAGKLKDMYIMGGAVHCKGNVTVVGEFNIATDPEAAAIVLEEAVVPTYVLPWETCCQKGLDWDWHKRWMNGNSDAMKFLKAVTAHTCEMDRNAWGTLFCPPDLIAMAMAIDKSMISKSQLCYCYMNCGTDPLTRGQLIVDWRGLLKRTANITICLDWSTERFKTLLETMSASYESK